MTTIDELSKLMKEGFEALNKRLNHIDIRLRSVETDVAWIKGKFEGRQEDRASVWQVITTATAVGAAIIALIALFLK
ncbi:MAG: hypothetical protein OXN25_17375 [Candidatus Poribacteria bacterium]|nr:hypothetical protein [Candidatus Poribacteria bacterium]